MNELILIPIFIIYILYISILFRISVQYLKYHTKINQILYFSFLCLGYGILFDCYRIISLVFFGFVYDPIDKSGFIVKLIFIFLGISAIFYLINKIIEQSGHKMKYDNIIRTFYGLVVIGMLILNIFTFYKTDVDEFGFYTYQIDLILCSVLLLILLPLGFYFLNITRIILKEIRNENIAKQIKFFRLLFSFFVIERIYSLYYYYLFPYFIHNFLTDLSMILLISIGNFLFFHKYPNFLENISAYFCVKSIYLVSVKGVIIYDFDFQKESYKDPFTTKELLTGGFLFILTRGIETILDLKGRIKTMNFGDINIIFKYSKYVFGLLIVTEYTPINIEKLSKFIEKFETQYEKELENWSGELFIFDYQKLRNWTNEIFR
ncbi:MAG: hypothetical protein HWN67_05545 [Candidatus Helarchaeota archaeon]|nr:hypothetical protein [Candidatus Helarchaeota archaeon]